MKKSFLYGTALMFSFAIVTTAFAGNDVTTGTKQTTAKKSCNGKCTGKCTGKKACAKPASKS